MRNTLDSFASISFNVVGRCLSFQFKFAGKGFVSLAVLGHSENVKKELAYFYRQQGLNKWVNSSLDLNQNGGNFYLVI